MHWILSQYETDKIRDELNWSKNQDQKKKRSDHSRYHATNQPITRETLLATFVDFNLRQEIKRVNLRPTKQQNSVSWSKAHPNPKQKK